MNLSRKYEMLINDENNKNIKNFARELKIITQNNFTKIKYEMLPLVNVGAAIALNKFKIINSRVYFAATSLVNAYKEEHVDLFDDEMENISYIRTMYFENALEIYNRTEDYIYAILYFNFNLYGDKLISNKFV